MTQGIELDEDLALIFIMAKDILIAARDHTPIATGHRADPDGGYRGYITWRRQATAGPRSTGQ